MKDRHDNIDWLRLDNAAKIFPATRTYRWNNLFRCSVVLKSRVDKDALQEAVEAAIKRYPMFQVGLRKGIFWYYFQALDETPVVAMDENYPCSMLDLKAGKLLFRVLYSRNRISIEFFHSLTDGYGGTNFLNTVLLKYFHIHQIKVATGNILHYDDVPDEEEFEDSYKRNAKPDEGVLARKEKAAYHIKGAKEMPGILHVTQGEMSATKIKEIAKGYGVTVHQLLAGIVGYISYRRKLYDNTRNGKAPIKIQVPIDFRTHMPSTTLRNFSGIINITMPEPEEGVMTFEEALQGYVKNFKDNCTPQYLLRFINANIGTERNWIVRMTPLFVKAIVMKTAYYNWGEKLYTMSISNMGVVKTPEEFKNYIDRYEFIIGPQKYLNYAMTAATFNDKMVISCSRRVKSTSFEREFFKFLASLGVDITINSNGD